MTCHEISILFMFFERSIISLGSERVWGWVKIRLPVVFSEGCIVSRELGFILSSGMHLKDKIKNDKN